MRAAVSPATDRPYPLTMICRAYRLPRATVSAATAAPIAAPEKRGPRTGMADTDLLAAIQDVRAACPFHGEGYRKVRARLAHRGLAVGGKRVLRLMRQPHLLAPRSLGLANGNPAHDGTLATDRPDAMQGTAATQFSTEQDGWCGFFEAIDHGVDEIVGRHVAKIGDRWATLEPLRHGVRHAFGHFGKDVARGLQVRCDWGPQDHRRHPDQRGKVAGDDDLAILRRRARVQRGHRAHHANPEGAVPVPASVRRLAEARRAIGAVIHQYNIEWLIARLGHRTPAAARAAVWAEAARSCLPCVQETGSGTERSHQTDDQEFHDLQRYRTHQDFQRAFRWWLRHYNHTQLHTNAGMDGRILFQALRHFTEHQTIRHLKCHPC